MIKRLAYLRQDTNKVKYCDMSDSLLQTGIQRVAESETLFRRGWSWYRSCQVSQRRSRQKFIILQKDLIVVNASKIMTLINSETSVESRFGVGFGKT